MAFLSSCTVDAADGTAPSPEAVNQTFTIELSGPDVTQTRAVVGSAAENRINDITILVFNATTKTFVSKIPGTGLTSSGTNGNIWTFKAEMPMGTYDLVALANASGLLTSITSGQKDTILAGLKVSATPPITITSGIPMWGELSDHTITSASSTATFKMMRMLAKINVSLGNLVTKFVMNSIYYINFNANGYLVPERSNYTESGGNITINKPSTYGDPGKRTASAIYYSNSNITGGRSCTDKIYVYEADHISGFPTDWDTDTDWVTNPCLVIGGYYDGQINETYYRVDFIEKDSSGDKWHSLLRNHAYQVVITSIDGPGYNTAVYARDAAPMNINASTFVSDESDMSLISMDGPYRMAISESNVVIARSAAPASVDLTVKTNYPEGWGAIRYTDAACTQEMTDTWMTLSSTAGVPTEGTTVRVSLKDKTVGSGYIKFTSGRMSLVVKVSCSIAMDFARSNVVQKSSSQLTFAITEADNISIPANVQGLHFRFGSLVGISSTGSHRAPWLSSYVTFKPSEYSHSSTWTWNVTATETLPYCNYNTNTMYDDYFKAGLWSNWDTGKRYWLSGGKGDICSYISDKNWVSGQWRMPTKEELIMLWEETVHSGEQSGVRYGGSARVSVPTTYGVYQMPSGIFMGAGADSGPMSSYDMKMPPKGVIFFPANGYRSGPTDSGLTMGEFAYAGEWVNVWSTTTEARKSGGSSTEISLMAYCINTYGGGGMWINSSWVRADAMAVRCIRE